MVLQDLTAGLSIAGSLLAGVYQLYLGYIYQSTDGFSSLLLTGWLMGDVLNIVGTVWSGQLLFQRIIALCSLTTDVCLLFQHLYYTKNHKSPRRFSTSLISTALKATSWVTVIGVSRASSPTLVGTTSPDHDAQFFAGQVLSWVAESFYVGAMIPQVASNFQRKCTGSVSKVMFLTDCLASVNYLATILEAAMTVDSGSAIDFLMEELPYLLGSAACVVLDGILLTQYAIYPQFHLEHLEGHLPLVETGDDKDYKTIHVPSMPEPLMHLP